MPFANPDTIPRSLPTSKKPPGIFNDASGSFRQSRGPSLPPHARQCPFLQFSNLVVNLHGQLLLTGIIWVASLAAPHCANLTNFLKWCGKTPKPAFSFDSSSQLPAGSESQSLPAPRCGVGWSVWGMIWNMHRFRMQLQTQSCQDFQDCIEPGSSFS